MRGRPGAVVALVALTAGLGAAWAARNPAPQPSPAADAAAAPDGPDPAALEAQLGASVEAHRKIIVLFEDETSLPPETQRKAARVGWILFHENHQRLKTLGEQLLSGQEREGAEGRSEELSAFLDYLEQDQDLRDADKLVFADTVADLAQGLGCDNGPEPHASAVCARLVADRAVLQEIEALYESELAEIFGRFETRGMTVRREAWESYVAGLRARHSVESILAEYASLADTASLAREDRAARARRESFGLELPDRSLVLTFDDGPHLRHTPRILEILEEHGVKAVFFQVGSNIGTLGPDGAVAPTRASAINAELLAAGHALANHSFSHAVLPRLSDVEIAGEIEQTNRLLREVAGVSTSLFRPPYGARNERVLAALAARNMRSIQWNVDTKDWADPIPTSIANRAIQGVEGDRRGILLFHDIHRRTVQALPLVLETLLDRGYQFLTWDGTAFVGGRGSTTSVAKAEPEEEAPPLYRKSWAVVVGIDRYPHWPRLSYAVNDARGVHDLLTSRFGFEEENVTLLLNEDATRQAILEALGDRLADPSRVERGDRVFVFFAGHGTTRRLASGRSLGYLVPVDAERERPQSQAISMTQFQDIADGLPAKHVLFVMDACYGGIALTRGGAAPGFLADVAGRSVRQVLTAGGPDQEVVDNGPRGHSVFTWALLEGLSGRADLNGDGYVLGSELAAFVGPAVSALAPQTPAFGNLPGGEGGDFVFESSPEDEYLNELSVQLDRKAVELNAELDRLRHAIAEKSARNKALARELAAARRELGEAPAVPPRRASTHIESGMSLYRERRYEEALGEFETATELSPSNALAANNAGFTLYKMGRLEDSIAWFEKTIALDPERAIAYLNLADACVPLGRNERAREAYARYLELRPTARNAGEVRQKLAALE